MNLSCYPSVALLKLVSILRDRTATFEKIVYMFIYCSLILYTLFAVCKQSLQINNTVLVSELNF